MMRTRPSAAAGFTIIELMATLVIAGILFTLAIPSFQGFVANQRVKTDTNQLLMSLLLARSEAIKRNGTVSITPNDVDDWAAGWSVVVDADDSTLRSQDALSGTAISTTAAGVTFNRAGRLTTASPTFTLCDANDKATRRVLTLDLSGQPRVELDGKCGT
jgi:prepilin-type N-terminal cleavage/methylation domain